MRKDFAGFGHVGGPWLSAIDHRIADLLQVRKEKFCGGSMTFSEKVEEWNQLRAEAQKHLDQMNRKQLKSFLAHRKKKPQTQELSQDSPTAEGATNDSNE
jgi:hypothetical protein